MEKYLSVDTIKQAYTILAANKIKNSSILHIFFILKGCNYNREIAQPISILSDGMKNCKDLSSLFTEYEDIPQNRDFINPFSMNDWSNNPTESLDKWMPSRVKNNILGGATTWRKIISEDVKTEKIKFSYNYLKEIKLLTLLETKLNLLAVAIWANRFTPFANDYTPAQLCEYFVKTFNITPEEVATIFESTSDISLKFENKLHDASIIRSLIGAPPDSPNWVKSIKTSNMSKLLTAQKEPIVLNMQNEITKEELSKIINSRFQIILRGPPGTSKSYLCKQLAEDYDESKAIQFHPQYTYQQFVGGHVVDGQKVVYRKGLLLDWIANFKPKKKYLLIIDEINRANVSEVFGEITQCLDRDYVVEIMIDKKLEQFKLPKNLHIIATMNTSDINIGRIDHAIARRFGRFPCRPNPSLLIDLCPTKDFISLTDFLEKVNKNLVETTKSNDRVIGHTFFLSDEVEKNGKYEWDFTSFNNLFNIDLISMIEDFCGNDQELVNGVLGEELPRRLQDKDFENAIKNFLK